MQNIVRISLYTSILLLTGCVSRPAGPMPGGFSVAAGVNNICNNLNGSFQFNGTAFRNGEAMGFNNASAFDVLRGCRETPACHYPVFAKDPDFLTLQYDLTSGLRIHYYDANGSEQGVMHFSASALKCTSDSLNITLHSGLAHDGPGAWTIANENVLVVLARTTEGKLAIRRESDRFDVFWFGLPVASKEGFWVILNEKK